MRSRGSGSSTTTTKSKTKPYAKKRDRDQWMPASRAGGHVVNEPAIASTSQLDGWLSISQNEAVSTPAPTGPISTSREISDRGSSFIAHAATCTSAEEAKRFQRYMRECHRADPADHEMMGWRALSVKKGRSGISEDDFEVATGADDDGEKNGGSSILKVLEREKALDSCIVISRWFGGTMLGPVRFEHIDNVATEAIRGLQLAEKVEELRDRDRQIDELCTQLGQPQPAVSGLTDMTIDKAERLLTARDKRIAILRQKLSSV